MNDSYSDKKILLCAWEFPGVNSRRGTALSRRIGQIARGFAARGWEVKVIHRDNIGELEGGKQYKYIAENGIHRYSFPGPDSVPSGKSRFPLIRKIKTVYFSWRYGDRSGLWVKKTIKSFLKIHPAYKPDLIVGFYTPRGPLLLARQLAELIKCPWVADLQDPLTEGVNSFTRKPVVIWSRKILSTASKIVHVSPEWAKQDSLLIGREIVSIRHAIPLASKFGEPVSPAGSTLSLLYTGRLDVNLQSPELLVLAIEELRREGYTINLKLCGHEWLLNDFKKYVSNNGDFLNYIGWLSPEEMAAEIGKSDVLLVIASNKSAPGFVPSKLYECLAFGKPVLIAGNEQGGIRTLLQEWETDALCDTKEKIKEALVKAFKGNFEKMLTLEKIEKKALGETQLAEAYLKLFYSISEKQKG